MIKKWFKTIEMHKNFSFNYRMVKGKARHDASLRSARGTKSVENFILKYNHSNNN